MACQSWKAICLLSLTQDWPLANQPLDLVTFSTLFLTAGCRGNFPKEKNTLLYLQTDPLLSTPDWKQQAAISPPSLGPSNVTKSILLGWEPALVTTSYSQNIKSDCPKDSSICVGLWCFIQTWKKCTAARVLKMSFAFCLPKVPPILPPNYVIFEKLLVSFISIETGQNHSKESLSLYVRDKHCIFILYVWILYHPDLNI